ncbi:MAG TPA: element excision factor XisH family protein [Blastocatellia bacterium]|nr:element excision factor XisH family protein [Blastocatellia bacterium]HMV86291.1 element excision factor XisH family protein [Blastocatellia bacterium]HMX29979.1 element excision factor XisH family protein [Blastocatellia bacterium]HMY76245.1 element excision factor XisH family protein [Blastocatellia bacterium]HMZ21218.1 element excision factor XisH family protein [Blastocatellia bacterium]
MPALDLYHTQVKNALVKDGWTITNDPLTLQVGERKLHIDLGAERVIAAKKANRKIAVEIKSFLGKSDVENLERALGQYLLYLRHLAYLEPDRKLYLAVPSKAFKDLFEEPIGKILLESKDVSVLVFSESGEGILQWIN